MNSPPRRFWPGDLTPLRASHVAPDAVWRSSSYPTRRRTSPSDTIRDPSLKVSVFPRLAVATFVLRSAGPHEADPVLAHSSAACKAEYRYEHIPPSASVLHC